MYMCKQSFIASIKAVRDKGVYRDLRRRLVKLKQNAQVRGSSVGWAGRKVRKITGVKFLGRRSHGNPGHSKIFALTLMMVGDGGSYLSLEAILSGLCFKKIPLVA